MWNVGYVITITSYEKLIATTRSRLSPNAMAFSAKQIPIDGTFQVKLLEKVYEPLGSLVSHRVICPIHCTYSKVDGIIWNSR